MPISLPKECHVARDDGVRGLAKLKSCYRYRKTQQAKRRSVDEAAAVRKNYVTPPGLADVAAIGAIAVTKRVILGTAIIWARCRVALRAVWFPVHFLVVLSHRVLAG